MKLTTGQRQSGFSGGGAAAPVVRPLEDGRKRRWLAAPERAPGRLVALLGMLFLAAYVASLIFLPKPNGRIVLGDAVHYFVYLRSAVFDRDLHFRNEYERIYGPEVRNDVDAAWIYENTDTGHTRNLMSIGPALMWAPLYLGTTAGVAVANRFGSAYPFDGFGRLFQASAGISGIVAATLGAWLAFLWARRVFGVRPAIWATVSIWLGSSAAYYSVISPTYSHAASMLTAGLFFYVWGTTVGRQTALRYALVGLLGGLAALVRWQDAIFLVAPFIDAVWHLCVADPAERPLHVESPGCRALRAASHLLACAAGALVGILPQLIAWTILFGNPLLVPQGEAFMRWTSPSLIAVLFSLHGLFSWTPVVALAVIGTPFLFRVNRLIAAVVVAVLLCEWYANAAVADWWAGEAFGARRFISCLPLFVLGLAALYDRLQAAWLRVPAITIGFTGLNFLLLVQYQAFLKGLRDIAPYPEGFYNLWVARLVVPFRLATWLWNALF